VTTDIVRVFEADPDLLRGIDPEPARRLRRYVVADVEHVAAGMPLTAREDGTLGVLVLSGMLTRRVRLAGRSGIELLGAGDVLRPGQDDAGLASLPAETSWRALQCSRLAVLDDDFLLAVQRHPSVLSELMDRVVLRCHALTTRLAIARMPRLDSRLLALLWHMADRWGRVEPGRVAIPLPLSHSVLADLVSAQRPSVSVVLKQLIAGGQLSRLPLGGWALLGPPPVAAPATLAPPPDPFELALSDEPPAALVT
jgi:CRP/FNR family cyclic AMP-dependent transcriptional regulator